MPSALTARMPCRSDSIERELDMCESGPLRGDEISHAHGQPFKERVHPTLDEKLLETNFQFDMSEESREGDEESGDEHSSGLQSDEQQELQYDDHYGDADAGLPGEMTDKIAYREAAQRRSAIRRS